jgi:hypothetical protein
MVAVLVREVPLLAATFPAAAIFVKADSNTPGGPSVREVRARQYFTAKS